MENPKISRKLSQLIIIIFLSSLLNADGSFCNAGYSFGSGTCLGVVSYPYCNALDVYLCECLPDCVWNEIQSKCVHENSNMPLQINCNEFSNNKPLCDALKNKGCSWIPPSQPGGGSCSSLGQGYGETCSLYQPCAACMRCVNGKCTQAEGICTTIPSEYVAPAPPPSSSGQGLDPKIAIEKLEQGIQGGPGGAAVGATSNLYKVGWFSDWKATTFIGVAIVISFIALAAIVGKAFNIPYASAFAKNEIKQALISIILASSLISLVFALHQIAALMIHAADLPIACNDIEPCYITSAKYYLSTLEDTAKTYAENALNESISHSKKANFGISLNANLMLFLFAGVSTTPNAGESLVAERYGAMFSQVSKMIVSLHAQRYFIDVVAFSIAPLFILFGVVFRTFFFTRKLGGLLLALAISLFIVYPLTFAFAWYTLNVTVHGDRMLAASDPACPAECTGTYPAAFFTDKETGQLVQFPTTQAILRAGINKSNWNSGGPDGKFPGLVACRNLSSINIPSSIAPNACADCPDYCREVPFPAQIPGCNITKCAACNPGCKITRQRLTCTMDPNCAGKCPEICRTRIPIENKCFHDEKGGVIEANLSVNCSGCSKYPHWCRFLKNESGVLKPVYEDKACKSENYDVSNDPTCPQQCSYITSIGLDANCDEICSYTDPATNQKTICPKECRVDQLLNNPQWASIYDVSPPNFTAYCRFTEDRKKACDVCKSHPECLIQVPEVPPPNCAPYYTGTNSYECLNCPDYCRHNYFSLLYTPFSQTERNPQGVPLVCVPSPLNKINCSKAGNTPACPNSCWMSSAPPICRSLNVDDTNKSLCRHCPESARFKVRYTYCDINCIVNISELKIDERYNCSDEFCPPSCKGPTVDLPNTSINPACKTFEETGCPYGCRVRGVDELDKSCTEACARLPQACFVYPQKDWPICDAYVGNGPPSCHSLTCMEIKDKNACNDPETGCFWDDDYGYCDRLDCINTQDENTCNEVADCEWMATHRFIKIENRPTEYSDRTACKQCPEQCRIDDYTGNCGVLGNFGDLYVDCSLENCPKECRIDQPKAPQVPDCKAYIEKQGLACEGCPVLCRRKSDFFLPATIYCPTSCDSCSNECSLENPPARVCEGCFDCDMDCTFYPAIRSDCYDICSDESLAGPVNIDQNDFIKSLPGAKTAYLDVKNVGLLFIPAVVLPLFCIVIVVSFVRVLSPLLGGDIEIPGLGRII